MSEQETKRCRHSVLLCAELNSRRREKLSELCCLLHAQSKVEHYSNIERREKGQSSDSSIFTISSLHLGFPTSISWSRYF